MANFHAKIQQLFCPTPGSLATVHVVGMQLWVECQWGAGNMERASQLVQGYRQVHRRLQ